VGMVLIDLQKAFDTVNHQILCEKHTAMGVGSVGWFESYLSCCRQSVCIGGIMSDDLEVTWARASPFFVLHQRHVG
jgi:hypothetical protein